MIDYCQNFFWRLLPLLPSRLPFSLRASTYLPDSLPAYLPTFRRRLEALKRMDMAANRSPLEKYSNASVSGFRAAAWETQVSMYYLDYWISFMFIPTASWMSHSGCPTAISSLFLKGWLNRSSPPGIPTGPQPRFVLGSLHALTGSIVWLDITLLKKAKPVWDGWTWKHSWVDKSELSSCYDEFPSPNDSERALQERDLAGVKIIRTLGCMRFPHMLRRLSCTGNTIIFHISIKYETSKSFRNWENVHTICCLIWQLQMSQNPNILDQEI